MGLYDDKPCPCGSGESRSPMFDARGIFCFYHCSECLEEKKSGYRPEIFEDCQYDTFGETVDEEPEVGGTYKED